MSDPRLLDLESNQILQDSMKSVEVVHLCLNCSILTINFQLG